MNRSLLLCSSTFELYPLTLDENPQFIDAKNAVHINEIIISFFNFFLTEFFSGTKISSLKMLASMIV